MHYLHRYLVRSRAVHIQQRIIRNSVAEFVDADHSSDACNKTIATNENDLIKAMPQQLNMSIDNWIFTVDLLYFRSQKKNLR